MLETAKQDLRTRESNREIRRQNKNLPKALRTKERNYVFLARHIAKAQSAAEFLAKALADISPGRTADRVDTLAIYSDAATLRAALDLARKA